MRRRSLVFPAHFILPPIFLLLAVFSTQAAPDFPHDATRGVGCFSCHDLSSTNPMLLPDHPRPGNPDDIDDTLINNNCWGCHVDADPPIYVETHSSVLTSTKHGVMWTVECSVCHNQHTQEQNDLYGTTYGKFIRTSINLGRIKVYDLSENPITDPEKTGTRPVKFTAATGPDSFADGVGEVNGICEVCHTKTSHWRNDGSLAGMGVHTGLAGSNCMSCHPHDKGFKADCDSCHGFPPIVGIPQANDGLVVYPSATGSGTAGAHGVHAAPSGGYVFSCATCHYNGMPDTPVNGNDKIQMGFSGRAITAADGTGTTYRGQTLLAPYSYEATNSTTVTTDESMTCVSLYCHGNYAGSGLNATPAWATSASGACGTCHRATNTTPPASGSHVAHASSTQDYACTMCHEGIVSGSGPTYTVADKTKHVNKTVDWKFDATDPRLQGGSETYSIASGTQLPTNGTGPNRAYGTCNNVYCHSSAQGLTDPTAPPVYAPPTWGTTFGNTVNTCNYSCHNAGGHIGTKGTVLTSGSHAKHLQFKYDQISICQTCHYEVQFETCGLSNSCHQRSSNPTHVNHQVNIAFHEQFPSAATSTSGTYTGTPTPGDAWGSCSQLYCHSPGNKASSPYDSPNNGAITWGGSLRGDCSDCHGGDRNSSTRIVSGSHSIHLGNGVSKGTLYQFQTDCSVCHQYTADDSRTYSSIPYISSYTMGQRYHADGHVSIAFKDAVTGASGKYAGQAQADPVPVQRDPGSAYAGCTNIYCHSIVQTASGGALTADTTDYKTPTWGGAETTCISCHDSVPPSGSHTEHIAAGRHCNNCHYSAFVPTAICTPCHDPHSSGADFYLTNTELHVNNDVNVDLMFKFTQSGSYNGTPDPGDGFSTCSNTYCHSNGTSVATGTVPANTTSGWGTGALTCGSCHGNPPAYALFEPKANEHDRHNSILNGNPPRTGYSCEICHYLTTQDGTTIASNYYHVSGEYDVSPSPTFPDGAGAGYTEEPNTFTYTYDSGGGTCANISCHSASGIDGTLRKWGEATMNVSFSRTLGVGCYGVSVVAGTPTCNPAIACQAPYTYTWDFGDGTVFDGNASETHDYNATGSFDITLTVTSTSGLNGSVTIPNVSPTATPNILPTIAASVAVTGVNEATITDLTVDPDYNFCDHSGPGQVRIVWGDGTDEILSINLTDSPSNQQFVHTYPNSNNRTIQYYIWDNADTWWRQLSPNLSVSFP